MTAPSSPTNAPVEDPVDPHRRIIDAHHHLWTADDPFGHGSSYCLDDLLIDTRAGHNVTDTVFVECTSQYRTTGPDRMRPVGETEFAAGQARLSDRHETRVAAIVAFADLTLGDDVDEVLAAHAAAGGGRFRGVRHPTATDERSNLGKGRAANMLALPAFRRGLATLGANHWSFDVWVFHPQLGELAQAARATPATTFVLDHLGAPLFNGHHGDRAQVRAEWRPAMAALAGCPNVVVKLGGIGLDLLFGTDWSTRPQRPNSDEVAAWWGDDIRWCIDQFGPSRCMFESNYPVDRAAFGYTPLWNAFQKIGSRYTDDEQDQLFAETAARTYRIDSR